MSEGSYASPLLDGAFSTGDDTSMASAEGSQEPDYLAMTDSELGIDGDSGSQWLWQDCLEGIGAQTSTLLADQPWPAPGEPLGVFSEIAVANCEPDDTACDAPVAL